MLEYNYFVNFKEAWNIQIISMHHFNLFYWQFHNFRYERLTEFNWKVYEEQIENEDNQSSIHNLLIQIFLMFYLIFLETVKTF